MNEWTADSHRVYDARDQALAGLRENVEFLRLIADATDIKLALYVTRASPGEMAMIVKALKSLAQFAVSEVMLSEVETRP